MDAPAALEPPSPSTPPAARVPSAELETAFSPSPPCTPRLPGEVEITAWLSEAGLDGTTGLAPALAQLCGGGVEALRVKAQLVSDDEVLNTVLPLGIRGIKLRKLQAALVTLRSPRSSLLVDEPELIGGAAVRPGLRTPPRPARPNKPALPASLASHSISPSLSTIAESYREAMPAVPESKELSDLAHLLSNDERGRSKAPPSKRDSSAAAAAAAAAASAAAAEEAAAAQAAREAARAARPDARPPRTLTLASSAGAASDTPRTAAQRALLDVGEVPGATPRTAAAIKEMLARDLQTAMDQAASASSDAELAARIAAHVGASASSPNSVTADWASLAAAPAADALTPTSYAPGAIVPMASALHDEPLFTPRALGRLAAMPLEQMSGAVIGGLPPDKARAGPVFTPRMHEALQVAAAADADGSLTPRTANAISMNDEEVRHPGRCRRAALVGRSPDTLARPLPLSCCLPPSRASRVRQECAIV